MKYLTEEDYETAAANGIIRKQAYYRWYIGWEIERCITEPIHKPRKVQKEDKTYKGKVTPEQYAIAGQNGINRNTVVTRVYQLKWSVSQAITLPIGTRRQKEPNLLYEDHRAKRDLYNLYA